MDGIKNPEIYNKIFAAIDSVKGVTNPHKVRVRQMGNMYMMDIDIEVNGGMTVVESHEIANKVERQIKQDIGNIYDIMIHIEPAGDKSEQEKFGVTSEMLTNKKLEEEKKNQP